MTIPFGLNADRLLNYQFVSPSNQPEEIASNFNLEILYLPTSCCLVDSEYRMFNNYTLEDSLQVGEIINIIDALSTRQIVGRRLRDNQLVVLDKRELEFSSESLQYSIDLQPLLESTTPEELLISLLLDPPQRWRAERNNLDEYARNFLEQDGTKSYNLLINSFDVNPEIENKIITISKEKLIKLIDYRIINYTKPGTQSNSLDLLVDIIRDDKIHNYLKRKYQLEFMNTYFTYLKNILAEEEYLEIAQALIVEMDGFNYPGLEIPIRQDMSLMYGLMQPIKDERISQQELINFANELIAIDINPAISLNAYAILTLELLRAGNIKQAFMTVLETLQLYDMPVLTPYHQIHSLTNTYSALVFIDYLMEESEDPDVILQYINSISESAPNFPEFKNYLLYRKALLMDLFCYPQVDVLNAFKQIDTSLDNIYAYTPFISELRYYSWFPYFRENILEPMEKFEPFKLKLSGKAFVKKNFMAYFGESIELEKDTEVEIIGKCPYADLDAYYISRTWVKGIINNEIYWIELELAEIKKQIPNFNLK